MQLLIVTRAQSATRFSNTQSGIHAAGAEHSLSRPTATTQLRDETACRHPGRLTVRPLTVIVLTMSKPEFTTNLDMLRWIGWAQQQAGLEWIRERDLSHQQSFVLGYLTKEPGAIQRDIAELTRTTPASVSSLLQGLEKRGLIERRTEPGNERSKRVYATDAGSELIAGFDTAMRETEESILAPLDQAERAALHTLLSKLTAELPRPTRP